MRPRHALLRPGVGVAWMGLAVATAVVGGWLLTVSTPAATVLLGLAASKLTYGVQRWRREGGQLPSQLWPPLRRTARGRQ